MQSKPDGFLPCRSPFDPVAGMRGDEQVVTRLHNADFFLALKEKTGLSGHEYHPLIGVLIIPLPVRS